MSNKPKQYDDDDGRVIINMNVEGMPWHDRSDRSEKSKMSKSALGSQLSRRESRLYTWYAIRAAMLIGLVFAATWGMFILFCTQIWFK